MIVADNLLVGGESFRAAASSGDTLANSLTAITIGAADLDIPGIAALDAAITAARSRQADHLSGNATTMRTAGSRYDDTDGSTADNIAVTM